MLNGTGIIEHGIIIMVELKRCRKNITIKILKEMAI